MTAFRGGLLNMKKSFLFAAVCAATFSLMPSVLSAQDIWDDYMEYRDSRWKKTLSVDRFTPMGYGLSVIQGDDAFCDQTSFGKNRNFFIGLFDVDYKPFRDVMVSLGVMLDWNSYRMNREYYWQPSLLEDNAVEPILASVAGIKEVKKSVLKVISLDFPLDITQDLGGGFTFTIGAAAEINFSGRTKFKGILTDGTKVKNGGYVTDEIRTRPVTYNIHAMLHWNDAGLFVKYNPESRFQTGHGPQFSSWTVGLLL